ncbi:MAG: metallophosphoesterase [Ignavibacterium sp.]|uniref:metallophosphoesterase n=1 Tax=Ignavibacterium sp. TaxID=2651167 RepID=UPI00404A9B4E
MPLFFIIFFTVYTALNSYVFIRGWQVIGNYPILKIIYLLLFIVIAYGYVFAKLFYKILPRLLYDIWLGIGAIWFALLVYFILTLLFIDIIRFLDSKFLFLPEIFRSTDYNLKRYIAIGVIVVVSVIVFLGNLNKRNIDIRTVELNLPKGQSKLSELNIVMASDIHLSPIDGERLLKRIVDKMNSLNPDIILLVGDIVDDKAEILEQRGIGKSFRLLKSKYGVYSINGNHEFINGVESSVRYGESLGIIFLRDKYILIDSSFYLIGREDSSMPQFTGKQRKSLEEIIENISDFYPKILLDHTPFKLEQAVNNNIDLQLSGHTHHGQIWPANLITNLIYEISWGYKKKGNTHFYVSSGAGTWGPPVRTAGRSEIVNLKIKFIDFSN